LPLSLLARGPRAGSNRWSPGLGARAGAPQRGLWAQDRVPTPSCSRAVKAGGMRIVQKHPHAGDAKEDKDKDDQEWESPSPPKPTVFISGVIARGDKDFPPAAAQVAHQKPHASMDKHASPRTPHIQQPRK
ncbi:death-associated protein 1, partial [Tupaia chinensis]|uniref:death-associated protein 1 n=1 Tax=Tupaia chinensis TaxID=246437 RepID=UPI000FFB63E9